MGPPLSQGPGKALSINTPPLKGPACLFKQLYNAIEALRHNDAVLDEKLAAFLHFGTK